VEDAMTKTTKRNAEEAKVVFLNTAGFRYFAQQRMKLCTYDSTTDRQSIELIKKLEDRATRNFRDGAGKAATMILPATMTRSGRTDSIHFTSRFFTVGAR
jgi:hypothetical protein